MVLLLLRAHEMRVEGGRNWRLVSQLGPVSGSRGINKLTGVSLLEGEADGGALLVGDVTVLPIQVSGV